jgi:acetylornithine deacetylase/succinyl-diaminopimelate desuccinylase-like protein
MLKQNKKRFISAVFVLIIVRTLNPTLVFGESMSEPLINETFKSTLLLHKEFVGIPNLPENPEVMLKNIHWAEAQYNALDFKTSLLETSTLPILLAEKEYDPSYKTVLFYFHIDGQPVNPDAWDQDDPFDPVLKEKDENG